MTMEKTLRSQSERMELFNKHKNLAMYIAMKYSTHKNTSLNRQDMQQHALLLLWELTERWEDRGEIKFSTFLCYHLKGVFKHVKRKWNQLVPYEFMESVPEMDTQHNNYQSERVKEIVLLFIDKFDYALNSRKGEVPKYNKADIIRLYLVDCVRAADIAEKFHRSTTTIYNTIVLFKEMFADELKVALQNEGLFEELYKL